MKVSVFLAAFAFVCSAHALRVKNEQVILDKLSDYELCQSKDYNGDWCNDALLRWTQTHPKDAFTAGKMTRAKMNAHAAIPFFTQAFATKSGNCADEDVWLAVESALQMPKEGNEKIVGGAQKIAFKDCFTQMKANLVKLNEGGGYGKDNVCKELVAKKAASGKCD